MIQTSPPLIVNLFLGQLPYIRRHNSLQNPPFPTPCLIDHIALEFLPGAIGGQDRSWDNRGDQ